MSGHNVTSHSKWESHDREDHLRKQIKCCYQPKLLTVTHWIWLKFKNKCFQVEVTDCQCNLYSDVWWQQKDFTQKIKDFKEWTHLRQGQTGLYLLCWEKIPNKSIHSFKLDLFTLSLFKLHLYILDSPTLGLFSHYI